MPWLMPWFLRCAWVAPALMLQVKRQVQERQVQFPDRARELRTEMVSKTIASLGIRSSCSGCAEAAGQAKEGVAMRRISILVSLIIVLAGSSLFSRITPESGAQEATPAAGPIRVTELAPGIAIELFAAGPSQSPGDERHRRSVRFVRLDPQGGIGPGHTRGRSRCHRSRRDGDRAGNRGDPGTG
jgi:hypothetical protein